MKTRIPVYVACILIIISIQSTVIDYFKINNVKPNLLLIFIICIALLRGNIDGGIVGFIAGLLQDILFGKVLGFYALFGFYAGITIGVINKRLYRENYFVVMFFTFTTTIIYEFAVYFFNILTPLLLSSARVSAEIIGPLANKLFTEAVYNSVVSIFMYILVIKINNAIENTGKISRKY